MMNIKPVMNEQEYDEALKRIDALFDAEPGTAEGDELETLFILVEAYESVQRVSEILNRKRELTLDIARKLHKGLGIPAEILFS